MSKTTTAHPSINQHTVVLPHPEREGPRTTGTCSCGWKVVYGFGGHHDAADAASGHVIEAGHAQPVQIQQLDGLITVMEGMSL